MWDVMRKVDGKGRLVGEPTAEDVERAVEEAVWRDVSSTPRS
jgi:hypothetical protein